MKTAIPPDTELTPWIRTSERLTLNQCEQKWEWSYVDRIKPVTPKPALRFGTLVHGALEAFYLPGLKRGPKPAENFQKLYAKDLVKHEKMGFKDEDGTWYDAGHLGTAMLEAYHEKFGKDQLWRVLHTEYAFHWPVDDTLRLPSGKLVRVRFVYVGVVDGIWQNRETKEIWVIDHKTTKDDPSKKDDVLQMDEQAGAYWSFGVDAMRAAGLISGIRLDGMMYNFLKKSMPDERKHNALGQYLNMDGTVSKKQPAPMFHRPIVYRDEIDGNMVRQRVYAQARRMRRLRKGLDPVVKMPGTLHNPHCKWCEFKDMCELHETGADWESFRDRTMASWEPYAQHEIMEGR